MIIGLCGYGYTGSGALVDLLHEFPCCKSLAIDFEFCLPYIPHGLEDLEIHLLEHPTRFFSSDVAIKEFRRLVAYFDSPRGNYRRLSGPAFRQLSLDYIDSLTAVKWRGYSWDDPILCGPLRLTWRFRLVSRLISRYERRTGKRFPLPKSDVIYMSVQPEDFLEKTRKYIRELLRSMGMEGVERIVLNQPFDASDPCRTMRYFDDPRAIMVDRDPRDIYVLVKRHLGSEASFIPSENVDDFITYYQCVEKANVQQEDDRILRLCYEDLIYDYERTAERIIRFLGLGDVQWQQKKYFDPAISIRNTQLYLRHPDLTEDIRRIEQALQSYLYPFEEMDLRPDGAGEPF